MRTARRRRFGHPYIVMHRGDLLNVLLEACRAVLLSAFVFGVADNGGMALLGGHGLAASVGLAVADEAGPQQRRRGGFETPLRHLVEARPLAAVRQGWRSGRATA